LKILITGIAGFVGSNVAVDLKDHIENLDVYGIDNFSRNGSEKSISRLAKSRISVIRGDIRCRSDVDSLPKVDWIIDCAANPSVLAGINNHSSSRLLMEHNLVGTINLLEYCKKYKTGLVLLSTSRVYSAIDLANIPVKALGNRYEINDTKTEGLSKFGISEVFPTTAPISLYGASKLASEQLILEYSYHYDFPVWINRCGVLAGAGQFGKADQGIFSFWIHSYKEKKPLKYIGFEGEGYQVRDAFHPRDLSSLLSLQINRSHSKASKIINLGGGPENSLSLRELSTWCEDRFGINEVLSSKEDRPMDAPWIVMDANTARSEWSWRVQTKIHEILEEISIFADKNPDWLSKVS
jgi:CDP-paratose 2-epimerase